MPAERTGFRYDHGQLNYENRHIGRAPGLTSYGNDGLGIVFVLELIKKASLSADRVGMLTGIGNLR